MTQTADLKAIGDALRQYDRFLVVTHENPGRRRARIAPRGLARAPAARQGRGDVPRRADTAAARVRIHAARRARARTAGRRGRARTARGGLRQGGADRRRGALSRAPLIVEPRPPPRQHALRRVNLIVADASSTGEVLRDVFGALDVELTPELAEPLYIALVTDTGRFQYANTTPKALRLAAELVEAGADIHAVFQQVYESVEFAKLKLLARALGRAEVLEGGRIIVSHLLRTDFARSRSLRAVFRRDHRLSAGRRRSRVGGFDP